jgi:hypothetical protein
MNKRHRISARTLGLIALLGTPLFATNNLDRQVDATRALRPPQAAQQPRKTGLNAGGTVILSNGQRIPYVGAARVPVIYFARDLQVMLANAGIRGGNLDRLGKIPSTDIDRIDFKLITVDEEARIKAWLPGRCSQESCNIRKATITRLSGGPVTNIFLWCANVGVEGPYHERYNFNRLDVESLVAKKATAPNGPGKQEGMANEVGPSSKQSISLFPSGRSFSIKERENCQGLSDTRKIWVMTGFDFRRDGSIEYARTPGCGPSRLLKGQWHRVGAVVYTTFSEPGLNGRPTHLALTGTVDNNQIRFKSGTIPWVQ